MNFYERGIRKKKECNPLMHACVLAKSNVQSFLQVNKLFMRAMFLQSFERTLRQLYVRKPKNLRRLLLLL